MSDKKKSKDKTIGQIGQMYENRKTGKRGELVDRDEEYRTLVLRDEETGADFRISYGTFKSSWRKVLESVELNEEESSHDTRDSVADVLDEEFSFDDMVNHIGKTRKVEIKEVNSIVYLFVDSVLSAKFERTPICWNVHEIYDLFNESHLDIKWLLESPKVTIDVSAKFGVELHIKNAEIGKFLRATSFGACNMNLIDYLESEEV